MEPTSTHNADLIRIGEFAELAGTSIRTIRYYEELGFLDHVSRTRGGFRTYRRCDAGRVRWITRLKNSGLTLVQIARELEIDDGNDRRARVVSARDRLRTRLGHLESLQTIIHEDAGAVRKALEFLEASRNCEDLPASGEPFCSDCTLQERPVPDACRALM